MSTEGFQPPENNYQQQPYGNQQYPYQPGQFQPPQPPQKRRSFRQWFGAQSPIAKIGLGCGSIFLILILCTCSLAAYGSTLPPQAQSSPTTNSNLSQKATTATEQPTVSLSPTATPTSTPSPTPTPSSTPTPKPTPKPTQPPQTLAIVFTCASAVDYPYGRICVHTLPGAALTITVTYCSGYDATSNSLKGTVYANGSGNYEWTWTPETKCRGGATAYVGASWHGQDVSNSDNFTVQ